MKTRLLIIIGMIISIIISVSTLIIIDNIESNSESLMESESIVITGIINHWQPIDGPAYSLITNEFINAQVSGRGIYLYGDMLRPDMKDKTMFIKGTLISNYVEYKGSLGLKIFGGDPHTAVILVDEIQEKYPPPCGPYCPIGSIQIDQDPFK